MFHDVPRFEATPFVVSDAGWLLIHHWIKKEYCVTGAQCRIVWAVYQVLAMRKQKDFRNLNDYRLALQIMRKFAPERFTASAGYDMRKWRDLSDIGKKEGAQLRKYYRAMRPLLVYGYQRRKPASKKKLVAQYKSLYGVKPLPGINRIPLPLAPSGQPNKIRFDKIPGTDPKKPEYIASVTVAPGVVMTRLTWAQMGYGWDDITGDNLANTITEIWQRFQPDYAGIIAAQSRVKRSGMLTVHNNPGQLIQTISRLQTRYDSGNHNFENWLDGLELYEFTETPPRPDPDYIDVRNSERKKFFGFLNDEEKRYKERDKLSRQIKNVRRSIAALDQRHNNFLAVVGKIDKHTRAGVVAKAQSNYDKQLRELISKRDILVTRLHLTKGF